jgi:hypothetical protein
MTIRESGICGGACWALTGWLWWFTVDLVWRADNVTSRQWQYLMSVPGHQWTWAALYAAAALILTVGMITTRYRLRSAGLAIGGFGALLIAAFYALAPDIGAGLTTLGYHPWLLGGGAMLLAAVVNWRPTPCF